MRSVPPPSWLAHSTDHSDRLVLIGLFSHFWPYDCGYSKRTAEPRVLEEK